MSGSRHVLPTSLRRRDGRVSAAPTADATTAAGVIEGVVLAIWSLSDGFVVSSQQQPTARSLRWVPALVGSSAVAITAYVLARRRR